MSPKCCLLGGGLAGFPGIICCGPPDQFSPPDCNNAMRPCYTLPHLFSQHACEVGRGRDCPHFTEEEVEAHRGQVTCPRSQRGRPSWNRPPEQAFASPRGPLQHVPDERMPPMPLSHKHSIEQPLICQTVCWARPPPGGLTQPCPPRPALWAQAFAAQGSEHLGDGSGGRERGELG